jgi:hypothetical protein
MALFESRTVPHLTKRAQAMSAPSCGIASRRLEGCEDSRYKRDR